MIARLLIGPTETRVKEVEEILVLNLEGYRTNNHPDLLYFNSDSKLGITEARKIKEFFSLKPYSAKGRAVILEEASNLTHEAQNALLKTLEELPKTALFILCANSDAALLPTVISRCQIIRITNNELRITNNYKEDIEKLLESSIEERFEYVEKLKDREEFFHSLVNYFHQNLASHLRGGNVNFLKKLLLSEEWQKQNVNLRAILEYLMLVMPARHRYAQALAGEPSK